MKSSDIKLYLDYLFAKGIYYAEDCDDMDKRYLVGKMILDDPMEYQCNLGEIDQNNEILNKLAAYMTNHDVDLAQEILDDLCSEAIKFHKEGLEDLFYNRRKDDPSYVYSIKKLEREIEFDRNRGRI